MTGSPLPSLPDNSNSHWASYNMFMYLFLNLSYLVREVKTMRCINMKNPTSSTSCGMCLYQYINKCAYMTPSKCCIKSWIWLWKLKEKKRHRRQESNFHILTQVTLKMWINIHVFAPFHHTFEDWDETLQSLFAKTQLLKNKYTMCYNQKYYTNVFFTSQEHVYIQPNDQRFYIGS